VSKLTPKKFMPAGWIAAVAGLAAIGVALAASAGFGSPVSNRHRRASVSTVAPRPVSSNRTVAPVSQDRVKAKYAALPLAFEKNEGQADPQIQYVARGKGYKLGLKPNQAIMTLPGKKRESEVRDMMMNKRRGAAGVRAMLKKRGLTAHHAAPSTARVEMNLLGANPHARLVAEDSQQGKVNYFLGKDPSKWISNVPLYGRVNYKNVYPGVDLAFHGAGTQLEFDYLVNPGADASRIALSFQGADSLYTDHAGNLVLATSAGPLQLNKPVAYQSKNGARELVDAKFVITSKNQVAFELGSYDRNRELVIDPTLFYSTYFGGDGADYASGIAVDGTGNAYVAGATDSTSLPGNSTFVGGFDSFVTKLDPNGALVFTTIFGGTSDEFPGGIAIDGADIYVSGTTDSPNFPATVGQGFVGGGTTGANDAYAVKLDINTGNFVWGTCIAGSESDSGLGVAVDSGHNVYVVGETFSNDLGGAGGGVNALPNGFAVNLGTGVGNDDGYIAKLTSDGTTYLLVSYIGGSSGDLATGVALDPSGNIYVSGETISNDFPTTSGAVQTGCGTDGNCNATTSTSFDDAFIVSIKANLSGYNYATYYGGSNVDDAFGITADASGNAFVTGTTASTDLLSPGTAFQSSLLGTQNAFLLELNSAGSAVTYNTYLGGDGTDSGLGVALDSLGNIYLTGQTTSSSGSFPLVNPTQAVGDGASDAFVSVLSINQGQLLFSTFLGGGGDEDQFQGSIGVDTNQNIFVSGDTDSGNNSTDAFPTTSGAIDATYGGGSCVDNVGNTVPCTDAFIASYNPVTGPDFALSATPLSPSSVNAGVSATSTVTVADLNGYAGTVSLTCSVTGNGAPLPGCSFSSTTLTVTTTGAASAMNHSATGIYYAMWLPVVGLSLVGMRFAAPGTRKKRLLGFLLLGLIMAALFFLPACGGSSNNGGGGGGGCTGCTPAGNYTVTVTGTDSVNTSLTHAVDLVLVVN
jgi:hypothetical protein